MTVFKVKLAFACTALPTAELLRVLLPGSSTLKSFRSTSQPKGRLHQRPRGPSYCTLQLPLAFPLMPSFLKEIVPCFQDLLMLAVSSEPLLPNTQKDSDIMRKA